MDDREPLVRTRSGAATHTGLVRDHNEDSYLAASPVFLVADGMGGHSRGDAASAAAVKQFEALAGREWVGAGEIYETMAEASRVIGGLASEGRAPGTTLAGVGLTKQGNRPYWLAFNIGDSRIYRLRDGVLEQISVDHSRRQELLEAGADPDALNIGRNIITRAIGAGRGGVPLMDQWLLPLSAGDRMLICSDGLSSEVEDAAIGDIVGTVDDPLDAARRLVDAALDAGGHDNVTVVVVDALRPLDGGDDDEVENTLTGTFGLDDDTEDDTFDLSGGSHDEQEG